MDDPVTIAQSGVDPTTGSYLSSEQRKKLFRLSKTRVSSKKVFGSGGGAIVPISQATPQLDPSSIVKVENNQEQIRKNRRELENNRIQISNLQSSVQQLESRNNQIYSSFRSFSLLQNQIDVLRQSINDLRTNLLQVSSLINQESQVERLRSRQEEEFNNRLASRKLREGKESGLEKKIQSALVAPVRAISQRVSGVLSDLMSVFQTLFVGWLANRYLDYQKAKSEENKEKLNNIKKSVIKNLLIVGGILAALNIGISRIAFSLGRLSFKIGKFVISNTIGRLFSAIGNLAKRLISKIPKIPTPKIPGLPSLPGGKTPPSPGGKVPGGFKMPNVLGGFGRGISKFLPFLNIAVSSGLAYENIKEGDLFGAGLNLGSMIPGPIGWASMLGSLGYETFFDNKQQEPKLQPKSQSSPESIESIESTKEKVSSPTTSMVPFDFKFGVDTENKFGSVFSDPEGLHSEQQIKTNIVDGEQKISPTDSSQSSYSSPTTYNLTPNGISGVSQQVSIGPQPDAKPNIIYRRVNNQQNASPGNIPLKTGAATNIPNIPSSNSDNIYIMYSMSTYNIV